MNFNNYQKMNAIAFFRNLSFFGAIAIPFFQYWGHLDYLHIFFLQAWFMFWLFVFDVPTGSIADVFGRKSVIIMSGIVNGAAALTYVIAPNFYLFMLAEFLWALSGALLSGADKAILYDTLNEERSKSLSKRVFARYAAFDTLGTVVGLPVGSVVAGLLLLPFPDSLRVPMFLTSLPMFAAAGIALTLREPKFRKEGSKSGFVETIRRGFAFFLKHRILKILAFDLISISMTTFFMFWFYQALLGNLGFGISLYGFVGAAFNIFAAFLLLKINSIEKMTGRKRLLLVSALIPGILYIVLAFTTNTIAVLAAIFGIVGFKLLREPLFDAYMNKYIPSKDRATVLSTISTFNRMALMIAYPIIGFLSDISLSYTFILLGVATIIFAFISQVKEEMLG